VHDLVGVPGLLSLARVPLAVLFVLLGTRPPWALALLALAAISDVLDGWSARRLHQATATGAVLDGVADKVFALAVVTTLLRAGWLSPLGLLLLATREIGELLLAAWVLLSGRSRAGRHEANVLGKLTTLCQFATAVMLVLRLPGTRLGLVATAVAGAAAAIAYARREIAPPRDLSARRG
jgi:CDP-diacylglycerol---glycerol-3-phosphate 3-phosphatidyltransferase